MMPAGEATAKPTPGWSWREKVVMERGARVALPAPPVDPRTDMLPPPSTGSAITARLPSMVLVSWSWGALQGAEYCTRVHWARPSCTSLAKAHAPSRPHQAQSGEWARHAPQAGYSSHVGRVGHWVGEPCRVVSSGLGVDAPQVREAREKEHPADKHGEQGDTSAQ